MNQNAERLAALLIRNLQEVPLHEDARGVRAIQRPGRTLDDRDGEPADRRRRPSDPEPA